MSNKTAQVVNRLSDIGKLDLNRVPELARSQCPKNSNT